MSETHSRIFIVDDDAAFCKSLARLVKSIRFDVETFSSADEFLEKPPYTGVGCLLLDVRMPGLTGPDLQQELHHRRISMPIIFLTAHGDTPTGVKAIKDGAFDFLLKPVEEKVLFDAIDKAMDKGAQAKRQQKEAERIGMLYGMTYLGANLQQSTPLKRAGDNPVTRQSRLQYLNLKFEQSDMAVSSSRPCLLQHHQQRRHRCKRTQCLRATA